MHTDEYLGFSGPIDTYTNSLWGGEQTLDTRPFSHLGRDLGQALLVPDEGQTLTQTQKQQQHITLSL